MTRAVVEGAEALRLDRVRGWVFDVDGCLVDTGTPGGVGGVPFPHAGELLRRLRGAGHAVLCCTNASARPPAEYAAGLRAMGLDIADHELVTAAVGAAHAVATRHPGARVLALGGDGIVAPLEEAGAHVVTAATKTADVVVVGGQDHYARRDIDAACEAVAAGAPLYVSVMTRWFYGGGRRSASVTSAVAAGIEWVTGVAPEVAGKPSRLMGELALARLGLDADEVIVVGDSIEAEVGLAAVMGAQSVWVSTGAPDEGAREQSSPRPTASLRDVGELLRVVAACPGGEC